MTFDEILEQLITLLKRQGRVSYRALKRRFDLDDPYLEALKGEIIFAYPVVDEEDKGLSGLANQKPFQWPRTRAPNLGNFALSSVSLDSG
jgi:hypothetical protein